MRPRKFADTRLLWAALAAGPVAWIVQLQSVYALAPWIAAGGNRIPLHLVSAACLIAAVSGGRVAWRGWRLFGEWPAGAESPEETRIRNLTVVGMMVNVLFGCVIIAQWVAVLLLPGSVTPDAVVWTTRAVGA